MSAVMAFLVTMAWLAPIKANSGRNSSCDTYPQSCPPLNYEEIDQRCCGDRAGKKLHCITTEGDPLYGCLENQPIPAGYAMSFKPRDSPETIELVPCEPSGRWYEPNNRSSIDVHHSDCTHSRTKCTLKGEMTMMICHGDGAADDQCGCADGYEPTMQDNKCWKGFGDNDYCPCQKKTCPQGTARNTTLYKSPRRCSGKREEIDYTCYPIASLSASTTPPSHDSSSSDPPHHSSSTPPPEKADTNDYLKLLWLLLLLPIFVIIYFLWEHLKKPKKHKQQNSIASEQQDNFLSESTV